MKKEKKIIWLLTGIAAVSLLVLCTVVIVRTATYPFIRTTGPDGPPRSVEPSAQAVERLAGGIRIPTVSDAIDRTTIRSKPSKPICRRHIPRFTVSWIL
jgi:hypothetical protein